MLLLPSPEIVELSDRREAEQICGLTGQIIIKILPGGRTAGQLDRPTLDAQPHIMGGQLQLHLAQVVSYRDDRSCPVSPMLEMWLLTG